MIKRSVFLLIIILAFILRFYKLGEIPVSLDWDEVSNAYNAYSILNTGRDEYGSFLPFANRSFDDYKPPLYMYLNTLTVDTLGLNALAARLPSAFFGFLSIPLIYFLAKLIFENSNKKELLALLSMFLFAIFPWHIHFSKVGLEANIGLFASLAFASFFLYGLKKYIYLIPSALFFGAGLYSYHAQRIFLPLFLIIFVFLFRETIIQIPKKFTLSFLFLTITALLSMFIVLPQKAIFSRLESSAENTLEGQKINHSNQIPGSPDSFADNKYIDTGSKYIENYFSNFSANFLFIKGDGNLRHHIENYGLVPLFYLPILLIGLYQVLKNTERRKSLIIIWLVIAPLPATPVFPAPHAIRSSLLMIPIVLISAFGLYSIFTRKLLSTIITLVIGVTLAISLALYLHNYYTHYAVHSAVAWQYGYKEAAIETNKIKNNFEKVRVSEDFEQAHIFWLFYNQYDPLTFQKEGNRGQFDKFYFGQKESDVQLSKNESELFVSYAQTFPEKFKVLKTIYYPNSSEAVKIGVYEKQ